MSWLRRNAAKAWAALLGALALVAGLGWLWRVREKRLSAEARADVAEAKAKVDAARVRRDVLLESADESDARVRDLDRQIDENEIRILSHHESPEGLTRDQIREKLRRLGL